MFGAVFETISQFVGQYFVMLRISTTLDCPRNRVSDDTACFLFDEEFGRSADNGEVTAIDVEKVRGGVDGAEVAVDVEGVEGGGACYTVRWHGLDDVATRDVFLQLCDMGFVAGLANVGLGGLIEGYRWLVRQRYF